MVRGKAFWIFISLFLCPRQSLFAYDDIETQKDHIKELLSAVHPEALKTQWQKLAPAPTASLMIKIFDEPDATLNSKIGIAKRLEFYINEPNVIDFLKNQAALETQNPVLRGTSLRTIASKKDPENLGFIKTFLDSADDQLRFAAAESLLIYQRPEINRWVEEYLTTEKSEWIIQKLSNKDKTRSVRNLDKRGYGTALIALENKVVTRNYQIAFCIKPNWSLDFEIYAEGPVKEKIVFALYDISSEQSQNQGSLNWNFQSSSNLFIQSQKLVSNPDQKRGLAQQNLNGSFRVIRSRDNQDQYVQIKFLDGLTTALFNVSKNK